MKLAWSGDSGYVLTLEQKELDVLISSLLLCRTHVSDAEYDIVTGRTKAAGGDDIDHLADQAAWQYDQKVREQLDRDGEIAAALTADEVSGLTDGQLRARIAAVAAQRGRALEDGTRREVILLDVRIEALVAALRGRGGIEATLRDLLESDDPGVRLTAAACLLEEDRDAAEPVLRRLAESPAARIAQAATLALAGRPGADPAAGMNLTLSEPGGYRLALTQAGLNLIVDSLSLCVTHVSDAEYDIVIGRPKSAARSELADLRDQADAAYDQRVREELERSGVRSLALAQLGEPRALSEEQLLARLVAESSQRGRALDNGDRRTAIVRQDKVEVLIRELASRGAGLGETLGPLLEANDSGVRLTAASSLLGDDPDAAVRVLRALGALDAGTNAGVARAAERTLRRWRAHGS